MRLYHSRWIVIFLIISLLGSCTPPKVTQALITVSVRADGKEYQVQMSTGSTAQEALEKAGISLSELDYSDPPLYTVLGEGSIINLTRVREEFFVEQVVLPFENQVVLNESLPSGETRLSQPGVNGLQEVTYRRVFENGIEFSTSVVKTVILQEPVPEIVMVGSQTPFASLLIPGRIAYLIGGNAWIIEGTTGNRRPVVTTSDLDGRIFSLSEDGNWLIYTRGNHSESVDGNEEINSLWAARVDRDPPLIVDLGVVNVIHFADWSPTLNTIGYSTVEPRPTAPGWQANNDLYMINVGGEGQLSESSLELEANSGGVYGWWGMDFTWGEDGLQLAFARPDAVGLIDIRLDEIRTLLEITPYQTSSDWAWVPGIGWGPDGSVIYTVDHRVQADQPSAEQAPNFDLIAIPMQGGGAVRLVADVGMFAYPVPSPMQSVIISPETEMSEAVVENTYQVAYLQAIFSTESDSSRYRLAVMDRDGSNRQILFPADGAVGLDPQQVVWSPASLAEGRSWVIAVIYQGNIWFINLSDGTAQQITGDGLTARLDWR